MTIPRKRSAAPGSTLHFAEILLPRPRGVQCNMAGPDFADIPGIIAMLNNHTRRTVCEYLAMQPLSMQQLSEYVAVKQPTFSYHMGALFDSHLVRFNFENDALSLNTAYTRLLARYAIEVLGGHAPIRF